MINAAMTPGTHPQRVSRNTMITDPHPRSITASGGKKMARMTRRRDIVVRLNYGNDRCIQQITGKLMILVNILICQLFIWLHIGYMQITSKLKRDPQHIYLSAFVSLLLKVLLCFFRSL